MTDLRLTASERFLLKAVDAAPDKVIQWSALRKEAAHMTNAGFGRVMSKMFRRDLLARNESSVTLTFKAVQALKAV